MSVLMLLEHYGERIRMMMKNEYKLLFILMVLINLLLFAICLKLERHNEDLEKQLQNLYQKYNVY